MAHTKSRNGRDSNGMFVLLLVLIVVIGIVAATGMVMAVLNYTNDNGSQVHVNLGSVADGDDGRGDPPASPVGVYSHDDGDVWRFAINQYGNRVEYLDEAAGLIKGYNVDIIHAVCNIAGKNCQIIQDSYDHCWESHRSIGGIGLMGGYYDACTAWLVTRDRLRVFEYTDSFHQARPSVFLVKPGNPNNFQYTNLVGKKIGFLDSWAADEHCVNRLSVQGVPINGETQVAYYLTQAELELAVMTNEVDAAFVSIDLSVVQNLQQQGPDIPGCIVDGFAMMARKGSALPLWWNSAFKKLKSTREYEQICADVEDPNVHGSVPGPPASQICV